MADNYRPGILLKQNLQVKLLSQHDTILFWQIVHTPKVTESVLARHTVRDKNGQKVSTEWSNLSNHCKYGGQARSQRSTNIGQRHGLLERNGTTEKIMLV